MVAMLPDAAYGTPKSPQRGHRLLALQLLHDRNWKLPGRLLGLLVWRDVIKEAQMVGRLRPGNVLVSTCQGESANGDLAIPSCFVWWFEDVGRWSLEIFKPPQRALIKLAEAKVGTNDFGR